MKDEKMKMKWDLELLDHNYRCIVGEGPLWNEKTGELNTSSPVLFFMTAPLHAAEVICSEVYFSVMLGGFSEIVSCEIKPAA